MKLIINADDCGKSKEVNAAIAKFIEAGKITSTTVMANMDDLEGAARLFRQYKGIYRLVYTSILPKVLR